MDLIYNPVSLTRLPPNFFVPKVKGGQPEEIQITIKCFRIFTVTEKIVFWNLAKKKISAGQSHINPFGPIELMVCNSQ